MERQVFTNECPLPVYDRGDLTKKHILGSGGNSDVYYVTHKDGGEYAAKIYKHDEWSDKDAFYNELLDEIRLYEYMSGMTHIVKVYGISICGDEGDFDVWVLMENYNMDLGDYIQSTTMWKTVCKNSDRDYRVWNKVERQWYIYKLQNEEKLMIMKSSLTALEQLHRKFIVHGDIKTNNMIWDIKTQTIILIDFGSSYYIDSGDSIESSGSGTPGYMAPEQMGGTLSYSCDIYSWAVSMIEIWNGDIWSGDDSTKICRNEVLYALRKIEKNAPMIGQVLRKCVSLDSRKRPSLRNIHKNI